MRTGLSAQRITPLGGALLVLACLFGTTPSTYAQIATGTYTGDGVSGRAINIGFQPDVVIIKVDDGLIATPTEGVIRTSSMTGTKRIWSTSVLNGYFHFPYHNSVSEELLKAEGKGIIAAFSPTGLSLNSLAHRFHKLLLDHMVHQEYGRLGDAILAGQVAYTQTGAFSERLNIYHLLGDPALRLR